MSKLVVIDTDILIDVGCGVEQAIAAQQDLRWLKPALLEETG